jgi:hypothetical protein
MAGVHRGSDSGHGRSKGGHRRVACAPARPVDPLGVHWRAPEHESNSHGGGRARASARSRYRTREEAGIEAKRSQAHPRRDDELDGGEGWPEEGESLVGVASSGEKNLDAGVNSTGPWLKLRRRLDEDDLWELHGHAGLSLLG